MGKIKNDGRPEMTEQSEYYLLDAPIEALAEYAGVDINKAVKMRVEAAVKIAPYKMDVTVRPIEQTGNLYGFASVKIGGLTVDGFKIVENKEGELFVGMPSKPDKESKTGYRNTVYVDNDFRKAFNLAVLGEYYSAVDHDQAHTANYKVVPDKARIADQMKTASEQADRYNAGLPLKENGGQRYEAAR